MSSIVEMYCNPYSCSTQILINGKAPADYSPLIQYANEPLYKWCEEIFDLIYNEINDSFSLIFVGRKFDADILRIVSQQSENCRSFYHKEFVINTPLQKRMVLLNDLVKKNEIDLHRIRIGVDFVIFDNMLIGNVNELEIKNSYCYVDKRILSAAEYNDTRASDYLFVICDDFQLVERITMKAKCGFVLRPASKTNIVSCENGLFFVEFEPNDFFEIVFECLLFAPLCDAFVHCIELLNGNEAIVYSDEFRVLTAIKPLVMVELPETVEIGRSAPLKVYTKPETAEPPEITFEYDKSGIVNCTNQRIEGIREGIVNILVFEKGSHKAFSCQQILVIKRNRITRLLLPDNEILLGENDIHSLSVEYFPENADNANAIEWLSTDSSIVRIEKNGKLTALKSGHCQVICSAEGVSTRINIEVKPYLVDLKVENIDISEPVAIPLWQDLTLSVIAEPSNAIDREFDLSSSDIMVVNIIGTTLRPVSIGDVVVTLTNSTGRVKKSIRVTVTKKEISKGSKKSFLDFFKKK
ncbi:MAG: hypothetical protein OSJ43_01225 [Oscillospiraceae bacterium]|nr:hypothetical protein [Oscillospiraceae bacterium]